MTYQCVGLLCLVPTAQTKSYDNTPPPPVENNPWSSCGAVCAQSEFLNNLVGSQEDDMYVLINFLHQREIQFFLTNRTHMVRDIRPHHHHNNPKSPAEDAILCAEYSNMAVVPFLGRISKLIFSTMEKVQTPSNAFMLRHLVEMLP